MFPVFMLFKCDMMRSLKLAMNTRTSSASLLGAKLRYFSKSDTDSLSCFMYNSSDNSEGFEALKFRMNEPMQFRMSFDSYFGAEPILSAEDMSALSRSRMML